MTRAGGWIAVVLLIAAAVGLWAATPAVSIGPPTPATGDLVIRGGEAAERDGLPVIDADARIVLDEAASGGTTAIPLTVTLPDASGRPVVVPELLASPSAAGTAEVSVQLVRVAGFGRWSRLVDTTFVRYEPGSPEDGRRRLGPVLSATLIGGGGLPAGGGADLPQGRYRGQVRVRRPGSARIRTSVSDAFWIDLPGGGGG